MNEHFSKIELEFLRREQMLLEQSARTKGGTTVLPASWDDERAGRLKRCATDFEAFCSAYFPELFAYPSCDEQREMTDAALRTDRTVYLFAADREFGKTVRFFAFKIWCGCFGHRVSYGKVSDTIDLVRKDFKRVRIELELNQRLLSDFGNILDQQWNQMDSFHVKPHKHNMSGSFFYAFSTTVTARGYRLDFLEFDDFEDFATSINPDISLQKLEIIERDFLPALLEHGSAVYLGNNARTTCLINILAEMSETNRKALHPAFSIRIIPAFDRAKNRPTWHQRHRFASEEEMRVARRMSKSVWLGEAMQEPQPPEGIRFLLEDWQHYDKLPRDAKGIMFCDPAFGENANDKAIACLLWSESRRKFYAVDAFTDQCGWNDYFRAMYAMYLRFEQHLRYVGWEEDFGQAQFLEFRKVHRDLKDLPELPIRLIPVKPWGDKPTRIEKLEYPFSRGEILFAPDFLKTQHGIRAQAQIIGYDGKKSKSPGYLDALASCYLEQWHLSMQKPGESTAPQFGPQRRHATRY